jgi:cytochrome c peroxidase
MARSTVLLWSGLSTTLLALGCTPEEGPFPDPTELLQLRGLHSMDDVPPSDPTNRLERGEHQASALALGTRLFHDTSLSACGSVSCASCHDGEGRTVAEATAKGCAEHQRTLRNPPTLLNAAYNTWFMWDGRADRLWSQAILPLTNPVEMASTPTLLRSRLQEAYLAEYVEIFGITPEETGDDALLANFGKLVAVYERTLTRTRAPFDAAVQSFITAAERGEAEQHPAYLGLRTFFRKGQCIQCHKGPALTDNDFHNIGVADDSEGREGAVAAIPLSLESAWNAGGVYSDDPDGGEKNRLANLRNALATDRAKFEGAFRTPSLRNVTLTAPYMHTGRLNTLEDVIDFYDLGGDADGSYVGTRTETVFPLGLTDEEKAALLALLESMTGDP